MINNNTNDIESKEDSNKKSSYSTGLQSISSHKDRKYDTIPFRIDFIRELLEGKNFRLKPARILFPFFERRGKDKL